MAGGAARALDHLVLPCADLDVAVAAFAALGFLVGPRNRHPWGTENHIIQFPGAFLELIALAPGFQPLAPDDPAFPFAGFLAGQGASRAPSAMLVLRSDDADADAADFRAAGIGRGAGFDFARQGAAPDGSLRTVAFSLAFAEALAMPDLGFFTCRQHAPEHFWDSERQRHRNGVTGVTAVVLAAERPADHAAFLEHFVGRPAATGKEGGLSVDLGDGTRIDVVAGGRSAHLAAIHFRTAAVPQMAQVGGIDLRLAD